MLNIGNCITNCNNYCIQESIFMSAKFFTFEGGEGCGKSTQVKLLADYLREQGEEVLQTREPGGSAGAEKIRELLLSETKNFSPKTEVLLNFAARLDHVEQAIKPALDVGKTVISDRFFDSTYVYQGAAQGVDLELIDNLRAASIGDFKPHLTFLLDIDPEKALKRAIDRGDANHFEAMGIDFHKSIREGFLQRSKVDSERFAVIDADVSIDELHAQIKEKLLQRTT